MASIRRQVNVCGEIGCSVTEALLDTGADRTLVPASMAKDLGLRFTGKRTSLKSASGHKIQTDEAVAHIGISRTGCVAEVPVVVPRDPNLKELIIGNDFMEKTGMVLGYTKPRIASCPSRIAKSP